MLLSALSLMLMSGADAGRGDAEATLLFSGDVTLGFHYQEYVDEQIAKGQPAKQMLGWGFEQVAAVTRAADLFVVNLECPFTDSNQKIAKNFNFKARPHLVESLTAGGVDVVSLANNHLMDFGPQGLTDTVATLARHGIAFFGAGQTLAKARAPAIVERKGITFAFLGYFFLGEANIEPKEVIAQGDQPGVAGHFSDLAVMTSMLVQDVKAAKARADHVICFFHWGREGNTQPEPYQVALAHSAIEAGAAAVIGSHPHVLQGFESYKQVPIAYSLGNFVFGGNWNPRDKRTALFELVFKKSGLLRTRIVPATSDAYPERPVQPSLLDGPEGQAVLRHLGAISAGFPKTLPQLEGLAQEATEPGQANAPTPH